MNSRHSSLASGQKPRLATAILTLLAVLIVLRWRPISSEFWLNLGTIQLNYYFSSDRPVQTTRASQYLETSLALNPTLSIEPALGYSYLAQGNASKAIEIWRDYPAIAAELTNRGNAANVEERSSWYQLAIEVDPAFTPAFQQQCNHYLGNGQSRDAIILYASAPATVANSASMKICVGAAYLSQNDTTKALHFIGAAVEQNPQQAAYWQWLSLALTRTGAFEDALNASLEATGLDASKPDYWEHLGNLYRETGQWDLARNAYEMALALVPENSRTQQALAELPDLP